jgi:hypothetical protein
MPGDPARMVAADLAPFLPGRPSLMAGPARPAAGALAKTIDVYPDPMVPEPVAAARPRPGAPSPIAVAPGVAKEAGPPAFSSDSEGLELVLHTGEPRWGGDLGTFLRSSIAPDTRRARVLVVGSGAHRFTPVRLPDGIAMEVRVEQDPRGEGPPSWWPDPQASGPGLIELRGGALSLSNLILRHDPASGLESLLALEDAHLVLSHCQLTVPPDSGGTAGDLIVFRAPTTRPMPGPAGVGAFGMPVDRPTCRLIDTMLIARRTAIRAELGRGLVALTRCAVASDETAIQLDASKVARDSFGADLWLDRCTFVAARTILGLGHWPGVPAGPDRPWLVNTRRCAFLTLSDARARDAALLRVDADAFAGGGLFWQADGDAFELDRVVACGEAPASSSRRDEISYQWSALLWPSNHVKGTVGPRAAAAPVPRRLRPGRIEPGDLDLGAMFPSRRGTPGVGADQAGPRNRPRSGQSTVRSD